MVVKLDRLARKATHNLAAFDLIESLGASLAIVAENIDTATTSGRLFRTMLAGMAEFERDSIVERMGSARYRKAQQGEWPGSPVPFGYKLAEDRRSFEIEKGEAATVKRAFELRLAGLSIPALASKLSGEGHTTRLRLDKRTNTKTVRPWKTSNVFRLLAQSVYQGAGLSVHVRSNPHDPDSAEEFHFDAPALVCVEDFEKANTSKLGNSPLQISAGKRRNLYAWSARLFHDHGEGELVSMLGSTRTVGTNADRKQREYLCSAGRRNPETGENPTCPSFGIVQGKPTTRVKADRIDALGLGFLLGLVRAPDKLKRIQADRDRQRAALDVDADRDAVENRIAQLDRRRAFLVNQAATDAEVGRLDRDAYNLALGSVDEDLDAARAELSRLDADAEEAAKVRMSIEEILGMVSNLSDEALAKMDGYTPDGPGRNAPERLTVGWVWMLQNEVAEALTPGMRGATSPLSKWAIEETRWLVERLGCFMVLSRNDGDGPRLIDRETGDNVAVGLAEKLKGQNPARWPDASIGIDVTLSTQRAALRGESAQVRHAINQQRPRQ